MKTKNVWNEKEFYEFQTILSGNTQDLGARFIELRNKYSNLDHNLAKIIAKGASIAVANMNNGCIFRSTFEYDGYGYTTRIVPNPTYRHDEYVGSYTDNDLVLMEDFLGRRFPNIKYRLEKKEGYIKMTLCNM